jgi:gliding motility associated protien GldN
MRKGFFILVLVIALNSSYSWSQSNLLNAKVPQEIGMKVDETQSPIAYGYIDDRDVLWAKTIWEIIDLNERINFPYYYPTVNNGMLSNNRKSLFRILYDAMQEGKITEIYSSSYFNEDEKLTFEELGEKLKMRNLSAEGISKSNAGEEVTDNDYDTYEIESNKIFQYRIKGTWYFNKRLGELKYRLLGIAPVAPDVSTLSASAKEQKDALVPLFWIWFPDAREVLANQMVFNTRNSSQPVTYDHMLNSRRFNATIYREENVYEDRQVNEYIYEDALRQLLESERIKSVIRDFEQDMWNN